MKIVLRTPQARRWQSNIRPAATRASGIAHLMHREAGHVHWAYEYAARLMRQVPPERSALIQSSMSPSGPFHIGNFRDSVTAHLVHRAVLAAGRSSRVLLSFDDFDPVRRRPAEVAAGTASAPLADMGPAVRTLCHDYLRELQAVGIRLADAPSGSLVTTASSDDASWQTHYQAERYRAGEYLVEQRRFLRDRRRIAGHLGVDRPEKLFAPYCEQCGRNTTSVLGRRGNELRYSCSTCGAHVHTRDLREAKPVWALDWVVRAVHEGIDCEPAGHDHCSAGSTMDRTRPLFERYLHRPQPLIIPYGLVRQGTECGKVSGSRGGGLRVRDLLRLLPPELVLWMYAAPDVRSDLRVSLGRPEVLRYYAEYDRFTGLASRPGQAQALWALLSEDDPPLPTAGFRRTLGALAACLFDIEATMDYLATVGPAPSRSRVELALHAAASWSQPPWLPATPIDPDPKACDQVLENVRTDGPSARLDRAGYRAVYTMLFGGPNGPSVRGLVGRLGAPAILRALHRFVDTGERPLRARALAHLAAARVKEPW